MADNSNPRWEGDLSDDCTAHWCGLTLRAEAMDEEDWWWAVYSPDGRVDSSNNYAVLIPNGERARAAAESAARKLLGPNLDIV